jgi:Dyp-type peroxidase family
MSRAPTLDLADIQGLLARGYGKLPYAAFVLLRVTDPVSAGAALDDWAAAVTPATQPRPGQATNIALTADGIAALTGRLVPDGFSEQFRTGMTTTYRSRLLGDVGDDDPAGWLWGGPSTDAVHAAVLVYAPTAAALDGRVDEIAADAQRRGWLVTRRLETAPLSPNEPFGFHDGISQPDVEGFGRSAGPGERTVSAGEFVLGYPNEYGQLTPRPLLPSANDPLRLLPRDAAGTDAADLGRNGSYLVVRQLEQDVEGFWACVDQLAKSGPDARERELVAAKLVGRWPSGAPLVLAPDHDDPALADANDFGYHNADPRGLACPIGAHIRRTNPRDSLEPDPGTEASTAINRRHRLLRRGRSYGEAGSGERGLHFVCLNANLARQFEFVQHTWVNNPTFNGLYDDADPVVGVRHGGGATFIEPAVPVRRRYTGLPQFVRPRGGAYFFLPGIAALHFLARAGRS